jgi:DNA-binding NarL/FixJ family response regulator
MTNPTDLGVLISCNVPGISRTVRMALRGMGVRRIFLEPNVLLVYVESEAETDPGLMTLRHIRRSPDSLAPKIPVVAISQRRDLPTINAVMNGGAHEYVLFPVSADVLMKRIMAACQSTRPFIETPDYVGPERKNVDVSKTSKASING